MSKITINNLSNSGIDVQSLIEKLVELKTIPINNLKKENDLISSKISKLNDFMNILKEFQDLTKSLYDYRSPFDEMKALSSDESIFTATAQRKADIGKKSIKVLQIAKSERVSSDLLDVKEKVGKVSFTITSGDTVKKVNFNGGSVIDFVNEIKKQAGDIVNVSVIYKDDNSVYITMESKNEGINNKLAFSEEVMPVLEKLGFYIKDTQTQKSYSLTDFFYNPDSTATNKGDSIIFQKNQFASLSLDGKLKNNDNIIISFDLSKTSTSSSGQKVDASQATGEGINTGEISVESDPIFKDKLAQPVTKGPLEIKVIGENGEKIITIENPAQGIKINKNELGIGEIKELQITNTSSEQYTISNFKVDKMAQSNGWAAKNLLQEAQNALIEVDGIRLEKSTNKIDDVIKGITLELKRASDKEAELTVDHDFDYVKDKIIQWVGKYNDIISFIKNEMSTDKDDSGQVKGSFTGDVTFMFLHNSLQKSMANFYQNDGAMSMLSQIGISTGKPGSTPQEKGGYLEIDEQMLDKALKENVGDVKQLFGFDSDNDLLPDTGVGVRMYNLMEGMTDFANGAIRQRLNFFDTSLQNNKKRIDTLTSKLEDYRDDLIYRFSVMEQMVSSLKSQGQYLSNYFNSTQSQQK